MSRIATRVCLSAACAAGAANAFAAGTLVGHWKFNEAPGATIAADSGPNAHAGALFGSAAFVAGGVEGNAISLTVAGGGLVEMATVPATAAPFSLSAWIKTTNPAHSIVAGRHVSTVVQGYFLATNAGGNYGLPGKAYAYVSTHPGLEAISTTTVTDGQWHHLVMTYSAGVAIFVDGVREATRVPGYAQTAAPFMVGGIRNPAGSRVPAFDGLIDDVQLFAGVLTGRQICDMFANPGQSAPAGCDGDANTDHVVNFFDLNLVLSAFGTSGFCLPADLDGDGAVNFADLNIVLSNFGQNC